MTKGSCRPHGSNNRAANLDTIRAMRPYALLVLALALPPLSSASVATSVFTPNGGTSCACGHSDATYQMAYGTADALEGSTWAAASTFSNSIFISGDAVAEVDGYWHATENVLGYYLSYNGPFGFPPESAYTLTVDAPRYQGNALLLGLPEPTAWLVTPGTDVHFHLIAHAHTSDDSQNISVHLIEANDPSVPEPALLVPTGLLLSLLCYYRRH